MVTPASKALKVALKERGKQTWLAKRLNVVASCVCRWANGDTRPNSYHQDMIEALLGIGRDLWLTTKERAERDALAKSVAA